MEHELRYRVEYQRIAGKITTRQWRNIKDRILIGPNRNAEPDKLIEDFQIYAVLRRANRRRRWTLREVEMYRQFRCLMPVRACYGHDLAKSIRQVLKGAPSDPTLYKWGKQIGIDYSTEKLYSIPQLQRWMQKVFCSELFQEIYGDQMVSQVIAS